MSEGLSARELDVRINSCGALERKLTQPDLPLKSAVMSQSQHEVGTTVEVQLQRAIRLVFECFIGIRLLADLAGRGSRDRNLLSSLTQRRNCCWHQSSWPHCTDR